jgi:hypothetical protein
MNPSTMQRRSTGSRFRKLLATALVGVALSTGPLVGSAGAAPTESCANFEFGGDHPGFGHITTGYYAREFDTRALPHSSVSVYLEGAGMCQAPGRQFVRVRAQLRDDTGVVTAFLQQYVDGETRTIRGTPFRNAPSGAPDSAHSRIFNAAGQTVRACGRFWLDGFVAVRCTEWVRVPRNAS